jgi:hypothetical protein
VQNPVYRAPLILENVPKVAQPSPGFGQRIARRMLASKLALLVALNRGAHFLCLSGIEATSAQALAGQGGEGIVGDSVWVIYWVIEF